MKLIARNKHKYTMTSEFPENFWEDWKENKAALKEKGYSPFKVGKIGIWLSTIMKRKLLMKNLKNLTR